MMNPDRVHQSWNSIVPAAFAVHHILTKKKIAHTFTSGCQLLFLGHRSTPDVDVLIHEGMRDMDYDCAFRAFRKDGSFSVPEIPDYNGHSWTVTYAPTNILIRFQMTAHLPNTIWHVDVTFEGRTVGLPCQSLKHLMARKILCLSWRRMYYDIHDLSWLYQTYGRDLDWQKLRTFLASRDCDYGAILDNYPVETVEHTFYKFLLVKLGRINPSSDIEDYDAPLPEA
ncbi:hypothetical protein HGRIS_003803 [Hohenbuehelia grisea]|uniref:Uncharacterized protein n=1 Tax=Hohenbuehelia grisea TaxID=104357 RepID=A0ABR3JGN0_9AGAR